MKREILRFLGELEASFRDPSEMRGFTPASYVTAMTVKKLALDYILSRTPFVATMRGGFPSFCAKLKLVRALT